MNQSLVRINESIAPDAICMIWAYAKMLTITGLTGANEIDIAYPGGNFVPHENHLSYELPQGENFDHIQLRNRSSSTVVVQGYLSQGRIDGSNSNVLAVLEQIRDNAEGVGDTISYIPEVTVQTTAVQIVAAATEPRDVIICHEYPGSGNYVWYGTDNTVTKSKWIGQTLPGGSFKIDGYSGAIWAISDTGATEKIGGYTK